MKWLSKTVALSSIYASDPSGRSIRLREKLPHVGRLADSIRHLGGEPIHPLTVVREAGYWKLVAGRDRYAALQLLKVERVPVRIIEDATPDDIAQAEKDENAHRRTMTPGEVETLTAAVSEHLAESKPGHVPPAHRVTAEVRKVRAAVEGKSVAAVRKAEQRANKATAAASGPSPAISGPPPSPALQPLSNEQQAMARLSVQGFEFFGTFPGLAWLLRIEEVIATIDEADKHCRLAQGLVTQLAHRTFPQALQQSLRDDVHRAGAVLRLARPRSVCPWCKDPSLEGGRAPCVPCSSTGYIVEGQRDGVPKDLLQSGVTAVNGTFVTDGKPRGGRYDVGVSKPFKAPPRVAIKLTAPDGTETDFIEPAEDTEVSA